MSLKINVENDQEADLKLIKKYFFDQKTSHFRTRILRSYKSLEEKIPNDSNNEDIVRIVDVFFRDIYENKRREIETIASQSQNIIDEKAGPCLVKLTEFMGYELKKEQVFTAVLTLLPFSPFNRPIFYFSITPMVFGGNKNNILEVAIHEISHFILFDLLDGLKINLRESAEEINFLHLFKEALTAMLLSEEGLLKLLGKEYYRGNPEVFSLNVKIKEGEIVAFREYLRSSFHQYNQEGRSFSRFIEDIIFQFRPKAKEFSEKKIFWNKNEQKIREGNKNLLSEYEKSILI